MKKDKLISRRTYLKKTLAMGTTALVTIAIEGCGKSNNKEASAIKNNNAGAKTRPSVSAKTTELNCNDASSLSKGQIQERASVNYMDSSPFRNKLCDNCVHYISGKDGECGTCKVVPGPIHPKGYCVLYHAA